jgi:hypothetical protein
LVACDCLFSIFAAARRIWKPSLSATKDAPCRRGWQGSSLTCEQSSRHNTKPAYHSDTICGLHLRSKKGAMLRTLYLRADIVTVVMHRHFVQALDPERFWYTLSSICCVTSDLCWTFRFFIYCIYIHICYRWS